MATLFPLSRRIVVASFALGFTCQAVAADKVVVPAPAERDTCPVCGMFVAPYKHWVATIVFKDNSAVHFDGAKDFFKFLFGLSTYAPGRTHEDIVTMGVTDYYELERINAQTALFVIGSDVLGPMGHELVPLANEADAAEFLKDHKGQRLLRFEQVNRQLAHDLDKGQF